MATEKRLIDANEIEELFYKQVEFGATDLMDAFDDALNDAQTVDAVEVVHGRWRLETDEEEPNAFFKLVVCTVCNKTANGTYNYCPNCGANMMDAESKLVEIDQFKNMDGDGNG